MKKIKKVIIAFIIIISLSACSFINGDNKTIDEQVDDIGKSIIESFGKKDKDSLISLFSKNVEKKYNIEKEIEYAFEFFDSEIVEYDNILGSAGGGMTTPEEGWVEREGSGWINKIKTQSGTTYTIAYEVCLLDKEDEDNVGVTGIAIINEDIWAVYENVPESKCTIGDKS